MLSFCLWLVWWPSKFSEYFLYLLQSEIDKTTLTLIFFQGSFGSLYKFKSDRPTNWNCKPCACRLFYLPFMALCHLFSVYMAVIIHILHDENQSLYLIFRLAEHLVTLTLYMALPLYHLEEMCHPDLTFWPALLFGTWKYDCRWQANILQICTTALQWRPFIARFIIANIL